MKKKIEQILNGKFEYEQPELLFSKDRLEITLEAGSTAQGEHRGSCILERRTMIRSRDILLPQIEDLFRETVGFRVQPYGCLMELTQWECRLVIYAEAGSV